MRFLSALPTLEVVFKSPFPGQNLLHTQVASENALWQPVGAATGQLGTIGRRRTEGNSVFLLGKLVVKTHSLEFHRELPPSIFNQILDATEIMDQPQTKTSHKVLRLFIRATLLSVIMAVLGFSTGELFAKIMFPICGLIIGLMTSFDREIIFKR